MEEDDGNVDRILPVAGREDLVDFQHLFFTETQRNLSDTHLWVSVFSRPRRSSFSRVQRLSCILCLLLATMMTDAMFYQTAPGKGKYCHTLSLFTKSIHSASMNYETNFHSSLGVTKCMIHFFSDSEAGAIEIGPVRVTMQELYVSFVSSFIILPINLLVDQLFRYNHLQIS